MRFLSLSNQPFSTSSQEQPCQISLLQPSEKLLRKWPVSSGTAARPSPSPRQPRGASSPPLYWPLLALPRCIGVVPPCILLSHASPLAAGRRQTSTIIPVQTRTWLRASPSTFVAPWPPHTPSLRAAPPARPRLGRAQTDSREFFCCPSCQYTFYPVRMLTCNPHAAAMSPWRS